MSRSYRQHPNRTCTCFHPRRRYHWAYPYLLRHPIEQKNILLAEGFRWHDAKSVFNLFPDLLAACRHGSQQYASLDDGICRKERSSPGNSPIDAVLQKGKPGEAYNIGGGHEITNLELTHTLLKEIGRDESFIRHVADRPGHDKRYALDISKISELGWKPRHKFPAALRETIDWYKAHEAWWKKLKKG